MPVADECFVLPDIRDAQPSVDADLDLSRHITAFRYHKIPEGAGACVIFPPQGEQAAEARTERVDAAAGIFGKKAAGAGLFGHDKVRKDQAFLFGQRNAAFFEKVCGRFAKAFGKKVHVIGIQADGIAHPAAAVPAAMAGVAVQFCHIFGSIVSIHLLCLSRLFVIGAAGADHESPVDLFQYEDPCHKMRKCKVGELPADVCPLKEGASGSQGAGCHKDKAL